MEQIAAAVIALATWFRYFGVAMLRGLAMGWCPYPFIDVSALGLPRVVVNPIWLDARLCSRQRGRRRRFASARRNQNAVPMITTRVLVASALASLLTACAESPTGPSKQTTVTFRVVNETFRILLTTPAQVEAARAAQSGGRAKIPVGRIVAGTQVNVGWSWHLEEVTFAEATIEVCDGLPSHVEREGTHFGSGQYCPWSAVVVSIDDRRR